MTASDQRLRVRRSPRDKRAGDIMLERARARGIHRWSTPISLAAPSDDCRTVARAPVLREKTVCPGLNSRPSRPPDAGVCLTPHLYRYADYDRTRSLKRVRAIPRSGPPPAWASSQQEAVQSRCRLTKESTCTHATMTAHIAIPYGRCRRVSCASCRHCAQSTTAATAIHDARQNLQLKWIQARGRAGTLWRHRRSRHCTCHADQAGQRHSAHVTADSFARRPS